MDDDEISNYLEYWMDGEPTFSSILGDSKNIVEDVEHHNDNGLPRTSIFLNDGLVLLFPPFQTGFDYTQINYNPNKTK